MSSCPRLSDNSVCPGHGHNPTGSISDKAGVIALVDKLSLTGCVPNTEGSSM
jgi:hypothetical protein